MTLSMTNAGFVLTAASLGLTTCTIFGAQVAPSLVPMLRSGSTPSNRNGIRERIE